MHKTERIGTWYNISTILVCLHETTSKSTGLDSHDFSPLSLSLSSLAYCAGYCPTLGSLIFLESNFNQPWPSTDLGGFSCKHFSRFLCRLFLSVVDNDNTPLIERKDEGICHFFSFLFGCQDRCRNGMDGNGMEHLGLLCPGQNGVWRQMSFLTSFPWFPFFIIC